MMASQTLKTATFTKTQKSRYFENETLFFLQIKGYFMTKNGFVAEVTFKQCPMNNTLSHTQRYIYVLCLMNNQKLTFFFKFNKFQSQKLFFRDFSHPTQVSQLVLKFRHVSQLRTKVQFYRAVDMKSSIQFKAFSPDTEVIE